MANDSIQTYQRSGRIGPTMTLPELNKADNKNDVSFASLVGDKFSSALTAGKTAESALAQHHRGEISQAEQSMFLNEASMELAEARRLLEMMVSSLQEIGRSIT